MRTVVHETDKDGNECWTIYLDNHQLSIYYTEEEAQANINNVQLKD
jgi:hypothetical protein